MATAVSLAPSALHARVQKLLGSRAELESTKALLHTLVTSGDASSSSSASSASSAATLAVPHGHSLADLRKNLRASLEHKQLALAETALAGLAQTLEQIAVLKGNVDALDAKCGAVQKFLESTKRETQQVQAEAAALATKKARVQEELDDVKAFLAKYQLTDDEIQALYVKTLADEDMVAFFPVMEHVQQVKADCRALVAEGQVTCALELLDTVGKYQEVGFERLYQWTTKKCAEVDGEPSTQLQRAIALLRDRPEFYNYCKESLTASRRSLIVRRFIIALTRGGPNGIPRPIEMYAHDPVRYCGDMLAWVHQAIATEHEFFRVLFEGDLEYTPSSHDTEDQPRAPDAEQTDAQRPVCTSMVGRTFDGVARPLQVRIEQTLSAHHGIVIAYRLVHLLAFYDHKFNSLVAHSGVAVALASCRQASNRAFQQQFQLLVQNVATSAQDYASNLAATHAVMDVAHRLVTLLEVFQSSLLPDHEKEADLAPLFDGVLPAVEIMCERTVRSLDAIDALVFRVNNLNCVRVPLVRFQEAFKWYNFIGDEIQKHLGTMSDLQAQRLLDRCNLSGILKKIQALERTGMSSTIVPAQEPGLDGETISSVMEDFSTALMSLVFPQFDHISQPDLREQARHLTATRLADAYTSIYDFVHDPNNGYITSHKVTGSMDTNHAVLLHSPHEVRTALEIE